MPNLAALMKDEISRLSRREVRREVLPLRRAAATYRREIAALKRALSALERRTKNLTKAVAPRSKASVADDGKPIRFVSKGLVSLRKRLGLSAADLARLLGVSMQSIYNWEHKKASPRKEQLAAIVALRSIGKNEADERLQGLAPAPRKQPGSGKRSRKLTQQRARKARRRTTTHAPKKGR